MMLNVDPNTPCMDTGKPPAKLPDVPKLWVKESASEAGISFCERPSPELSNSQDAAVFTVFATETWANSVAV